VAPLGSPTERPLGVATLLEEGELLPRKWLVHPESAIALVWGAGTIDVEVRFLVTISL